MDDTDAEELDEAGCLLSIAVGAGCIGVGAGCIGVGIMHGAAYGFLALAAACVLAALAAVVARRFG